MLAPLVNLLLVTLVFLVILLVALPEFLKWLAGRNVRQRHELIQAVRHLEKTLQQLIDQLEAYRDLQAPQYRQTYQTIHDLLQQIQANRQALVTANTLRFPKISTAVWPAQHFASHPYDIGQIVLTFRRLQRFRRSLEAGNTTLAVAQENLKQLHQMPQQFKQECEALLRRLKAVKSLLQGEQRAGITALEVPEGEHGRLHQSVSALNKRLTTSPDIALTQADQFGQELITLEEKIAALEATVQKLHRNRLVFDARLQTIQTAFAALGDTPQELDPLADVIRTLLAETAELRQHTVFAQAEPLLKTCEQWARLGKTFQQTNAQVSQLLQLQNDALKPADIRQVNTQLQRVYRSLAGVNALANRPAYAPFPSQVERSVASLVANLAQIQETVSSLRTQYQHDAQEQAQVLKQQEGELAQAWKRLNRVIKVAKNEPLARRYQALSKKRSEARGKPAPLRGVAAETAELRQDILESAVYLEHRLQVMAEWVHQLPAFERELNANEAGMWHCLRQQVDGIKRDIQGLQQDWKNAKATGWLDETHEKLDAIKMRYQGIQQLYQGMNQQLYQLNQVDSAIQETIEAIQRTADSIDPNIYNRMMELVNSNYQHALQAPTFDEAMSFLRKAEEFAHKLAMR